MNTEINYFHRDEDNFKDYFRVVVAGELTTAQEHEITDLMPDGEFFPSDIGLDENESCEWWGIKHVDKKPTINMTVDDLVARFHKAYDLDTAFEGKRPYSVTIKEISSRTIIVWAENHIDAEQKAEDLCNVPPSFWMLMTLMSANAILMVLLPKQTLTTSPSLSNFFGGKCYERRK